MLRNILVVGFAVGNGNYLYVLTYSAQYLFKVGIFRILPLFFIIINIITFIIIIIVHSIVANSF